MPVDFPAEAVDRYLAVVLRATGGRHLIGGAGWTRDITSPVFFAGTVDCVDVVRRLCPPPARVLDYGCGKGTVAFMLATRGYRVSGVDVSPEHFAQAAVDAHTVPEIEENLNVRADLWQALTAEFGIAFAPTDGASLPHPDRAFDAVVVHAVWEHVNPPLLPALVAEFRRVLGDGGWLFVFRTPRRLAYLERLARVIGIRCHLLTYDEHEVAAQARTEGFELVQSGVTDFIPGFPSKLGILYRWFPDLFVGLDHLLLRSPLRRYAHHMSLAFRLPAAGRQQRSVFTPVSADGTAFG